MNIKKELTSIISIVFQVVILVFAIIWYVLSRDIEPLIVAIGTVGTITTTLVTRLSKSSAERSGLTIKKVKGKKGITIKTNQGAQSVSKIRDLESDGRINIESNQGTQK